MNPLWKVFSNFYSKAERAPLLSLPSLFSLVWSGADTRSNHRPGSTRSIPRRVGKSQAPLQSIKSQLFPVPLWASGLERAVKAISTTSSVLESEWGLALGGISTAALHAQQISACVLCCRGPEDVFLHWSDEYLMISWRWIKTFGLSDTTALSTAPLLCSNTMVSGD